MSLPGSQTIGWSGYNCSYICQEAEIQIAKMFLKCNDAHFIFKLVHFRQKEDTFFAMIA
jgi:hypothetical protein